LHRYVFHWVGKTRAGRRFHFLLHGVHHEFPQDKDRLVMPIGFTIPHALLFFFVFRLVAGPALGELVFTGFAVGYLMYDGIHYAVHHFKLEGRMFRWVRRHHMMHHHQDHAGGFGVSSPLWDLVFGTMPKPKGRPQSRTL
jgi:sterol desaturase/sphingolipid hydroxylase (fatty acid hydroxylase superfamily)